MDGPAPPGSRCRGNRPASSRLELPRTASNEERFSPPSTRRKKKPKTKKRGRARSKSARAERARQKKIDSPQMWLTTMFHVGTGLPWDWRTGPSNSSERKHFQQHRTAPPPRRLWSPPTRDTNTGSAIQSERHLLIRVERICAAVEGIRLRLGSQGVVYLWPDREAARPTTAGAAPGRAQGYPQGTPLASSTPEANNSSTGTVAPIPDRRPEPLRAHPVTPRDLPMWRGRAWTPPVSSPAASSRSAIRSCGLVMLRSSLRSTTGVGTYSRFSEPGFPAPTPAD